jgi:ankyrin repeat protein
LNFGCWRSFVAQVDALNLNGETPLHLATANGHFQVVEMLLKHDCNVLIRRNNDGMSALHLGQLLFGQI